MRTWFIITVYHHVEDRESRLYKYGVPFIQKRTNTHIFYVRALRQALLSWVKHKCLSSLLACLTVGI